jgi:hypothetical protein
MPPPKNLPPSTSPSWTAGQEATPRRSSTASLTRIQAANGWRFPLRSTGYRFRIGDRLGISGSYPDNGYISSHDDPPSIGATSCRSPKAKAIKRRFLLDFHRFHELAVERKRQYEE